MKSTTPGGPVYVIHLEDPPDSGRAACTGEQLETLGPAATPRAACSGCTHVIPRLEAVRDENRRLLERLSQLSVSLAISDRLWAAVVEYGHGGRLEISDNVMAKANNVRISARRDPHRPDVLILEGHPR